MVVIQPSKRWDKQDKCGGRDRTPNPRGSQSREDAWESDERPVQNLLAEGVAELTRKWQDIPRPEPWRINRSIDTTVPLINELSQEVRELRKMVEDLSESNAALESRLSALEKQLIKEPVADNLWEISDRNLKHLEELSGITLTPGKPTELDPFDALKGLLIEYSDDTVDSVELVNSVRGK